MNARPLLRKWLLVCFFWLDGRLLAYQLLNLFHCQCVRHRELANLCASESCKMSPRLESKPQIPCQGTNICAFGTSDPENKLGRRIFRGSRFEINNLLFCERHLSRLELNLVMAAFARIFVGSMTIHTYSRERGRHLVHLTKELAA